jgi:hypothetical protein
MPTILGKQEGDASLFIYNRYFPLYHPTLF